MSHVPPAAQRNADAAGFILAGGHSSRMGRDKALLELRSTKLIEHVRRTLTNAGIDVWMAGARNPELASYAPVIPDEWVDVGPLGGVCSALRYTDRSIAVFLPVDQPLVPPALILGLLDHARKTASPVTLASVRGEAQTFPAVVRRDTLAAFEGELNAGRRGCLAAFRAAGLHVVAAEEVAASEELPLVERWFWNVNTPEDLERVESALKAR